MTAYSTVTSVCLVGSGSRALVQSAGSRLVFGAVHKRQSWCCSLIRANGQGQHLSGSLHVGLNIPNTAHRSHSQTDCLWMTLQLFFSVIETDCCLLGCIPGGVESLCTVPENVCLVHQNPVVHRTCGGRAWLWDQPTTPPQLTACPLFPYGEGAVGCR